MNVWLTFFAVLTTFVKRKPLISDLLEKMYILDEIDLGYLGY